MYWRSIQNVANRLKIIEHETNRGISAVRNTGLKNATGQYIIYCDSDDWVEKNMYEKLLVKALETSADIVGCDFFDDYCCSLYNTKTIISATIRKVCEENAKRRITLWYLE